MESITEVNSETAEELERMDESLLQVVNSGWKGLDIAQLVKGQYAQDNFFKIILEDYKSHRNFEVEDGLIFLKESDRRVLCIPHITYRG
jgi:hypothetical protein